MTDGEGIIMYWNPFAEELYGWPSKEVVGRNITKITVTAKTQEEAKKDMVESMPGNGWSGECEVRCKNGELLSALLSLSPMVNESGSLVGFIGVSQDLTGRKEAEEQLRKAAEELEKRVIERTAELNDANKNLRDLSARLLQMRDLEARQLARELHDSVGQLLAAISMNISTVKSQVHKLDEAGANAVAQNTVFIEQISTEIRTISHLLHPPVLDELGLASAVKWYVEGFSERSKIEIEVEIPAELARLSVATETAIFRIVQECLTNIHRHSGSKTGSIRICAESGKIIVVARDFGRGMPPDQLRLASSGHSGVGFRGIRERLRFLGGTLAIHSNSNGTVVTATFPLQQFETAAEADRFT
jgi:PAS domain S-box-containing protein